MEWDGYVALYNALFYGTLGALGLSVLVAFGLRVWEMRKAELELKALKKYLDEKYGGEW